MTSVISKINKRLISKTFSANDYNVLLTVFRWNSVQSIHPFKFHEVSKNDALNWLDSLSDKNDKDNHGFDRKLRRRPLEHIIDSFLYMIIHF